MLSERGVDPFELQKTIGHADIRTTAGYVHREPSAEIIGVDELLGERPWQKTAAIKPEAKEEASEVE